MDNNVAIIAGKITEEFKRNTDIKIGKELYSSWIEIVRDSGTIDNTGEDVSTEFICTKDMRE